MRLLAIDTSTKAMGLALYSFDEKSSKGWKEGTFDGVSIDREAGNPSDDLFPSLLRLGEKIGLDLQEESAIDAYAVALGPGSFTGLRIGVTTAKTLAQFSKKALIGISTLRSMAWGWGKEDLLQVPVIDARANRIYGAAYAYPSALNKKDQEGMIELISEDLYYEEDFLPLLELKAKENGFKGILFIGQGIFSHPSLKKINLPFQTTEGEDSFSPVRGLAYLAAERLSRGESDSCLDLAPQYLRKSQAEMDRERRERK